MKSYYQSVIGALLHDIGKLVRRQFGDSYRINHECDSEKFILETFPKTDFFKKISSFVSLHHDRDCSRSASGKNNYTEIGSNKVFKAMVDGDRISAAEREPKEQDGEPNRDPLIPISARVKIKLREDDSDDNLLGLKENEEKQWGFALDEKKTFPFPSNKNPKLSQDIYKKLNDGFKNDFGKIITIYKSSLSGEEDLENFVVSLLSVLKRYTSYIPSASFKSEADISLFDHSRVAAAVAGCLYHKHDEDKPFIYLAGDLSGIQNFIYNIVAHNEDAHTKFTKRLRGRSLYISLLTDGIAHYILRELGLSEPHLLLSGGGNFNILLPNSTQIKNKLDEIITKIQRFLHEKFQGKLGIATTSVETDADELMCHFDNLLYQLGLELDEQKKRKLQRILDEKSGLKDILCFPNDKDDKAVGVCPSCGDDVFQKGSICNMCKLHQEIGEVLPKAKFLYFVMGKYNVNQKSQNNLVPIEFGEKDSDVLFTWILSEDEIDDIPEDSISYLIDMAGRKTIDFLPQNGSSKIGYSYKWIGKYLPGYDNDKNVLTFEDIANESQGAKYLGVVRMDVDNMGAIFALGFDREKKIDEKYSGDKNCKLASISRFAQLSRQLDTFFSGYLVEMLKNDHPNVYLGYSGGDDLFFVASWNEAIEISMEISDKFKKYMSNNPVFHLSGGMIITKPKFPIAKSSFLAGEKEERAKKEWKVDGKIIKIEDRKNRFSIFNRVLRWDELKETEEIKDKLKEKIEGSDEKGIKFSRIVPYRLLQLIRMHTIFEKVNGEILKKYHPALIPRIRLYLYRAMRNADENEDENIEDIAKLSKTIEETIAKGGKGIDIVEVALNWCALEMREKTSKEE